MHTRTHSCGAPRINAPRKGKFVLFAEHTHTHNMRALSARPDLAIPHQHSLRRSPVCCCFAHLSAISLRCLHRESLNRSAGYRNKEELHMDATRWTHYFKISLTETMAFLSWAIYFALSVNQNCAETVFKWRWAKKYEHSNSQPQILFFFFT
jgi:hypothetical protein